MDAKPNIGIDLDRAKVELNQYGFTLLPNLLARDAALEMAEKLICLERLREEGEHPYQHLTSLFNHLDSEEYEMFLPLITNPIVLRLAEDTLGGGIQLIGSDVKWTRPGTAASGLHADVPMGWFAEQGLPVPENVCFIVQCNWMLTDFTRENGATELLPQSHRFEIPNMWPDEDGNLRFMNDRVRQLRREVEEGDPNGRLAAAEGSAGSAVVFKARCGTGRAPTSPPTRTGWESLRHTTPDGSSPATVLGSRTACSDARSVTGCRFRSSA